MTIMRIKFSKVLNKEVLTEKNTRESVNVSHNINNHLARYIYRQSTFFVYNFGFVILLSDSICSYGGADESTSKQVSFPCQVGRSLKGIG